MKRILGVLKFLWEWIRIIYTKTRQMLSLMRELLRPGRSRTNRVCVIVWVVVIIAFIINSFVAFYTTTVELLAATSNRCDNDLAAMKSVCDATLEDLDQSSDTIKSADALKYLMQRLKSHKPSKESLVCIADTTGKVLQTESSRITHVDVRSVKDDDRVLAFDASQTIQLDFSNTISLDTLTYNVTSAPIWDGRWSVVVLQEMNATWGKLLEIFFEVSKRCVISILLAIVGFLAMFIMMRHAMLRKNNMEGEIDLAAGIQQQMLPKSFPVDCGFDLYGFLRPAKTMGGDLYDFIQREGKLFFCIGDVSGKGMPAALLMSEVRSLFRNVARHTDRPEDIVSAINVGVADGNDSNMFCTLFVGVLDVATRHLNYCNAGHNPPALIAANGNPQFVDVLPNLAVGLFDEFVYQSQQIQMQQGMSLFVYTDGVTEAEDALSRLFSDDALLRALAECPAGQSTSKGIIEHVLTLVDHHARYADQSDDITMLCLKV